MFLTMSCHPSQFHLAFQTQNRNVFWQREILHESFLRWELHTVQRRINISWLTHKIHKPIFVRKLQNYKTQTQGSSETSSDNSNLSRNKKHSENADTSVEIQTHTSSSSLHVWLIHKTMTLFPRQTTAQSLTVQRWPCKCYLGFGLIRKSATFV